MLFIAFKSGLCLGKDPFLGVNKSPSKLRASADELALLARNNRLMLGLGLAPTLAELLEKVNEAELPEDLSVLEQMNWVCSKLGGPASASSKCGIRLLHSILASISCLTTVISSSGDERIIEASAASSADKRTVLRWCSDLLCAGEKAVLPLHNSPHHVLFVGCSSSEFVNAIRSAKGPSATAKKFGTMLVAHSSPIWKHVAGNGVDVLVCSEDAAKGAIEREVSSPFKPAPGLHFDGRVFFFSCPRFLSIIWLLALRPSSATFSTCQRKIFLPATSSFARLFLSSLMHCLRNRRRLKVGLCLLPR